MARLRAALGRARHALPDWIERTLPGPGPKSAERHCRRLARNGLGATAGYFQGRDEPPEDIVGHCLDLARRLADTPTLLAVKAPPLGFDPDQIGRIAGAGVDIVLDAHAARDADRTLEAAAALLPRFPGTGFALPARWRRSAADADAFRDGTARIRLVKGEWADPDGESGDPASAYLGLAARLAGRSAPVGVATHDPELAERALALLLAAGTPCELEQLRGLPSRRTMAVARRLGVAIRVYVPCGPGWWPYAVDQALARPYLLSWMARDRLERPPGRTGSPRPGEAVLNRSDA